MKPSLKSNEIDIGLTGIQFIEFSSSDPQTLEKLFFEFGFSKTKINLKKKISYFNQNQIHFLLNTEPQSFGHQFYKQHGPSISSMGWMFKNPEKAFEIALSKGAKAAHKSDYYYQNNKPVFAIEGIGGSLIYFIEDLTNKTCDQFYEQIGFHSLMIPELKAQKGFTRIDHLTNNVAFGTMNEWANFYKNIFGFKEVRYFDIRGVKTGLTSYALKSPCGTFCIPINEAGEEKSQINEYLREYHGPGIQHLAFLTDDILKSLDLLKGSSIQTLDIDSEYYEDIFERVKNVTECHEAIQNHKVLVDGDEDGYLLQIFTKNIIGPIFIEIIQRKNHHSFGEGNFKALFRSIERDQHQRGVL